MKDIRWDEPMPKCDLRYDTPGQLATECGPGEYDAPTRYGPWANLCEKHMKSHGIPGPAFHRVKKEK
jgi:hypothetical protein